MPISFSQTKVAPFLRIEPKRGARLTIQSASSLSLEHFPSLYCAKSQLSLRVRLIDIAPEQARRQIDQQKRALPPRRGTDWARRDRARAKDRIVQQLHDKMRSRRSRRREWRADARRRSRDRKVDVRLTCKRPLRARTRSMMRRIETAKPSSSSLRMSITSTPRFCNSRRSPVSIDRMPNSAARGSTNPCGSPPNTPSRPGSRAQHRERHAVHILPEGESAAC